MTNLVIGHRGSPDKYPENTMLSYRKAIEEGARAIEMDVRKSVDGVFYIMHDATVDRTTDGSGVTEQLDWAYLSTLDAGSWMHTEFAGREDTKVPRLDNVLEEFKGKPIILVLHIKLFGIATYLELVDFIKSRGMLDQVVFFGASNGIGAVKAHDEKCFVMNDGFAAHVDLDGTIAQALAEKWDMISISELAINKSMVDTIHSNGILVNVSLLSGNYAAETLAMLNLGVDFILTNNPIDMMATLNNNYVNQITTLSEKDTGDSDVGVEPSDNYEVKIKNKGKWIDSVMRIKKY